MSMTRDRFAELTAVSSWATIDDLVRALDDGEFWTPDFYAGALLDAKKATVRRFARMRGSDGIPLLSSVVVTDGDGEEQRVYKPERLFNVDDYVDAIHFHRERSRGHAKTAADYERRGRERFGEQLMFALGKGVA